MHELVLVLSDLYVSQEAPDRELPDGVMLPGLQQAARFGARSKIAGGWRPWLSRWLTGIAADGPPATVVAGATPASFVGVPPAQGSLSAAKGTATAGSRMATGGSSAPLAWIATPVHLIAGMTSIHLDRRSILHLDPNDQVALVADFQRVFHDSGFYLQSLDAGDFLMLGPQMPIAETLEPARFMGESMADAQRGGAASPALLRFGAELEMWLHDHPVNDARRRRGELPVTALWLWGGGNLPARGEVVGVAYSESGEVLAQCIPDGDIVQVGTAAGRATSTDITFGRDSYLAALSARRGAKLFPLPQQLADVFGYPHAHRAVLVIELGVMLQSNPWTFFDALAHIDRSFIAPAIEALSRGQCKRLTILANDYALTLRPSDRFKFWRRTPSGLSGLQ